MASSSSGTSPVQFSAAVAERAAYILQPGTYWGFAEWIAWGWASETQVTLHVADGCWPLFEAFVPKHISLLAATWTQHLHVICVSVSDSQSWMSRSLDRVNHYIYTLPTQESLRLPGVPTQERQPVPSSMQTHAALTEAEVEVVNCYGSRGFVVLLTKTDGNCAPDCISLHEGQPSGPAAWKATRQLTHDSMLRLRMEWWWLDCFEACQENRHIEILEEAMPPSCSQAHSENEPEEATPPGSSTPTASKFDSLLAALESDTVLVLEGPPEQAAPPGAVGPGQDGAVQGGASKAPIVEQQGDGPVCASEGKTIDGASTAAQWADRLEAVGDTQCDIAVLRRLTARGTPPNTVAKKDAYLLRGAPINTSSKVAQRLRIGELLQDFQKGWACVPCGV